MNSGAACPPPDTLAFDAAGDDSAQASTIVAASDCPDTFPPTPPLGLVATGSTLTSLSLDWAASSDDVGVAGYTVFLNGAPVATTPATSYTVGGLFCGTSYTVAVDAYDAAGNHSLRSSTFVVTAACPDTTPPNSGPCVTSSTRTAKPVACRSER